MFKVMLRDNMSPIAKEILEATGEISVTIDNDKATNEPKALAEIIGEYDALAVRSGTKVTKETLEKAGKLKVIGRAGAGVDNIDVAAASARGIVVMNAPGGNTVTTAEHALSMMLSLARSIPQATASVRAGKWDKKKFMGVELRGKTLGIVGLGQIGRVVASRALGFQMTVIATDPFVTPEAAREIGVEAVDMAELFARADFITLHVPKMEETKNLVRAENIAKMKKGVRIINCSRGEVVNLDDLATALESGRVAGAALDVFPKEPPDFEHPIFKNENAIFTPHLGASTEEAQDIVADMIARQTADYLLNGVINNAVNFPSIAPEAMERLRPYLNLAERMGSLLGQLMARPRDVTITYAGEVAALDTRPLMPALLKGLLGAFTDQPVNYVSATALAKQNGINVRETVDQATHDYTTLIKLHLDDHDTEIADVWGTIFGKKNPRIVRLGRVYMDAIPEGPVLIIQNHDKPGVIGNIGNTLARHGINIGQFQLGRAEGRAVCFVNVDAPVAAAVVEELRGLPNVVSVRQLLLN